MTTTNPARIEDSEARVTTVIADDLEITGTIRFKSSLMIKGNFEGEIFSEGLLIVGPTAVVKATISTSKLITYGTIIGNLTAEENVVLKSKSSLTGDITTPNVIIENGSIFSGSCIMKREYSPPPPPKEPERSVPPPPQFDYKHSYFSSGDAAPPLDVTKEVLKDQDRETSAAATTDEEEIKVIPLPPVKDEKIQPPGIKKKGFWNR